MNPRFPSDELLDALPDGLLCIDSQGTMLHTNAAMERLTGFSRQQLVGHHIRLLFPHEQDKETLRQLLLPEQPVNTQPGQTHDLQIQDFDGNLTPVGVRIQLWATESEHITVASFRDLTERKRYEENLHHLARHDPLTGLINRRQLRQEMQQYLTQGQTSVQLAAVLFLDLDRFKPINDRHGHAMGDQLLIHASQRMRATLRQGDILARLGGDEFIVLINHLRSHDDAIRIAEKLKDALGQPYLIEDLYLQTGCSMGLTFFPEDAVHPDELLRCADVAMYCAKHAGGDALVRYHSSMKMPVLSSA